MKLPEDVRQLLLRKFRHQHCNWLNLNNIPKQWPLIIGLGTPTEQAALQQPDATRHWIAVWQQWQGPGQLIWDERSWKILSSQRLPNKLILNTPEEVALWIGEFDRWQQAKNRFDFLLIRWPNLSTVLARYFDMLADYNEADFHRLLDLVNWIVNNPNSHLYPRQVPIAGLDSKWLEKRKKLVGDLVATILVERADENDFYKRCGLRAPPNLIRLRILDENLRNQIGGIGDIITPCDYLAALKLPISRVIIVENLQTGLAFPDFPGTIVIMKLGYSVDILAKLAWLTKIDCYYWGDIDTHGFAILNRLRTYLSQAHSIMMDEQTLLLHQELWGDEEHQHHAQSFPHLSNDEQSIYKKLKQHFWKQNLRLEQERINWNYAMNAITKAFANKVV